MICQNCGAAMVFQRALSGGYHCPACPEFTPPPAPAIDPREQFIPAAPGSLVFTRDPTALPGAEDVPYVRLRKLEERVAKLESYIADDRRRKAELAHRSDFDQRLRRMGIDPEKQDFPESGSSFRDPAVDGPEPGRRGSGG